MKEEIIYKHWMTEETFTRKLSPSWPVEHKTDLICPFDYTQFFTVTMRTINGTIVQTAE